MPYSGGHVLFAGRLAREKGLDVLLAAARLLPDVPVVIAGDGPIRGWLESDAPGSVRFLGDQTPDELRRLRADAVAQVSPSTWYENAPLTVLEAMRDGRPSIVSATGGQTEIVDGGSGLVVPPRAAVALADAIRTLWQNRSLAEQLGQAARQRLLASYTLDRHVSTLEGIYGEAHQR